MVILNLLQFNDMGVLQFSFALLEFSFLFFPFFFFGSFFFAFFQGQNQSGLPGAPGGGAGNQKDKVIFQSFDLDS